MKIIYILFSFAIILSSCSLGSQSQAQQPDPRLKLFSVQSARIVMLDNSAEVDGTVQNVGHDPFPFDVTIDATFYDSSGNIIGHAEGVAEDVFPDTTRPFILMGQVDSVHYSHMKLTPVSLREVRYEKNLPTPTPVVP